MIEINEKFDDLRTAAWLMREIKNLERDATNFGADRIKAVRSHYNITQKDLASRLMVTKWHLCKVEKGREPCSMQMLANLWSVVYELEGERNEEEQGVAEGLSVAEPGGRVEVGAEG